MALTRRGILGAMPAAGLIPPVAWSQPASPGPLALWYREPAKRWLDALPIGNGRLGAMVFGDPQKEILALNESTVWSGGPNEGNNNPSAREYLEEMRRLMFGGQFSKANALARQHLLGREDSYGTHLPMAQLLIDQNMPPDIGTYQRVLELETGLARIEYASGAVRFAREIFASNPHNVIVLRLSASQAGKISIKLALDPKDLPGEVQIRDGRDLVLVGSAWEKKHSDGRVGVNFQVRVRPLLQGGTIVATGSEINIQDADSLVLLIAANTNYEDADFSRRSNEQISVAAEKGYAALRDAHIADHRRLFSRVDFDIGGYGAAQRPTNERLAALRAGSVDPQLSALFFQYGRYLLIAGSRENSPLPLNLQGIWNDNLAANMVWTCDFHLDINTQQNYWPSESCNLTECGEPLFRLLESLSKHGNSTAQEVYGADGWVAHVYTNAWGFTAPGAGLGWGPHVSGGAWAASHLWEHYLFTRDREFLARRAWPVLKGLAEFFVTYLVEHPTHTWLVTGPSISPENQFLSPADGKRCSLSMGPTHDIAIVASLFDSCLAASNILGTDAGFRAKIATARSRLPPFQIGKHGQLQEWLEDFDEAVPNHRHTSHLVSLYPLGQITPQKTPALANAARIAIERRTGQVNWEDVEWSRANLLNYYARLRDGDLAHKHFLGLLGEDTDNNLMTFSRAGIAGARDNIFAMDGNCAGTAGVAEMLLQSHDGLDLLPALPTAWPEGKATGLRARGGFEVDLWWADGSLKEAKIKSQSGGRSTVRYRSHTIAIDLKPGASVSLEGRGFSSTR